MYNLTMELVEQFKPEDGAGRFLRVDEHVFITPPVPLDQMMFLRVTHKGLATQHDVLTEIERRRLQDPASVDGGFYAVNPGLKTVDISYKSSMLDIPVGSDARLITREVFQAHCPDGFAVNIRD